MSTTGGFGMPIVLDKYPQNGVQPIAGSSYDSVPTGGFGGMGIVQLMTPPGTNADGTNTILDDNVLLFLNGVPLTGSNKQRYLAWRGFLNASGLAVDDFGAPTNVQGNEGDIRPTPHLLPVF